jgi:hypothetical protein
MDSKNIASDIGDAGLPSSIDLGLTMAALPADITINMDNNAGLSMHGIRTDDGGVEQQSHSDAASVADAMSAAPSPPASTPVSTDISSLPATVSTADPSLMFGGDLTGAND